MKKVVLFICVMLALVSAVVAQKPVQNINSQKRPNLAAAQRLAAQAFDKVVAAQTANEFGMEGHAKRAKELLIEVNKELKLAAGSANKK